MSGGRPIRRGSNWTLGVFGWMTILLMTISPEVYQGRDLPGGVMRTAEYAANPVTRFIKLALLIGGGLVVIQRWGAVRALIRQTNPFFLAFLALVPLSYLWSISPANTMARFITLSAIVLVWTAICVASWSPHRMQEILRPVTTLIVLGSIVYALTSPDFAIEKGEGTLKDAWRGLATQKNGFGQLCSFGFIFWWHGWLSREVKTWQALLFGGCSAACVLFSRSSTSLLATVFACVFLLMLLRTPASWRRRMPYLIAIFAAVVLTYALTILKIVPGLEILLKPITSFTGKDMTFSNRSVIWEIIKEHIQFAPFLGSGYSAFWIGPDPSSPSYQFLGRMYFYPNESHNGYLEIVNDLGFVGLFVLFGYFFFYIKQSLRLWRFDRTQAALYLAMFFQQSIINLSESCWLYVNCGYSATVMLFATIALARSCVDHKPQRPPAPSGSRRSSISQPALVRRRV